MYLVHPTIFPISNQYYQLRIFISSCGPEAGKQVGNCHYESLSFNRYKMCWDYRTINSNAFTIDAKAANPLS